MVPGADGAAGGEPAYSYEAQRQKLCDDLIDELRIGRSIYDGTSDLTQAEQASLKLFHDGITSTRTLLMQHIVVPFDSSNPKQRVIRDSRGFTVIMDRLMKLGLSQRFIARWLEVEPPRVSRWLKIDDPVNPSDQSMRKYLGMIADLLTRLETETRDAIASFSSSKEDGGESHAA